MCDLEKPNTVFLHQEEEEEEEHWGNNVFDPLPV